MQLQAILLFLIIVQWLHFTSYTICIYNCKFYFILISWAHSEPAVSLRFAAFTTAFLVSQLCLSIDEQNKSVDGWRTLSRTIVLLFTCSSIRSETNYPQQWGFLAAVPQRYAGGSLIPMVICFLLHWRFAHATSVTDWHQGHLLTLYGRTLLPAVSYLVWRATLSSSCILWTKSSLRCFV